MIDRVFKGENIPNPSAHNETIVGIDLNHRVVNNNSKVESLDLRLAGGRLADVEQTELAGLAALGDTWGQTFSRAGVGAIDDEGFVGEFCTTNRLVAG